MSQSHFLTLDANKKPSIRKGVDYQSYIPAVLPGPKIGRPKGSGALKKVHVALDVKVGNVMEKMEKSFPEMGPFNMIAPEHASEYLKSITGSVKSDGVVRVPNSSYWDHLQDSLDKIVKQEGIDDGVLSSGGFSLESLRSLLSQLEAWNERAIRATLGTGQVLSSEVDELLEEARLIGKKIELPKDVLARLRVLQRAGQSFSSKVQTKLSLKTKEKVPLAVLTDLMKEAEALPIETEEVRFFRNQRGRIHTLCHSAQKATKDKSLEKSKEVTIEAAEIRAILPDLMFLKEKVSIGEWVQKALSKVDKRASVPLSVIEQLFDDPSAALIKPEECEIMQNLLTTMREAQAWQTKAQKTLAGIAVPHMPKRMPSIDTLQALLDEHASLSKVSVPSLSSTIEGLIRRAKAWIKKQERTLSGTWSLGDAKNLLDEGKQISSQVDLNPEIGVLDAEVEYAEKWCSEAKSLIASLALSEIDRLGPLVDNSFRDTDSVPPSAKRARNTPESPQYSPPPFDPTRVNLSSAKQMQALKNYENSMTELSLNLTSVKSSGLITHLETTVLPTQDQLESLKSSLGIVRDPNLEIDITQLHDGAQKWADRAATVIAVPFPRPAGVLRALSTLIHDLRVSPMRYRYWSEIVEIAAEEVWAHNMRYVTLPLPEGAIEYLMSTCPFRPNTPTPPEVMDVDARVDSLENVKSCRARENEISSVLQDKQDEWIQQVLGLSVREDVAGPSSEELGLVEVAQEIRSIYANACKELLNPRRASKRAEAEEFLQTLKSSPLLSMPSLITRVETAIAANRSFEATSVQLREKLREDHAEYKSGIILDRRTHNNGLFHELLSLLESVENAEIRVEHFDAHFTPLVSKLLKIQGSIRGVFKWDPDEVVTEPGFRPTLEAIESSWNLHRDEADESFQISEWFLQEVAYLASAHNVLSECRAWRVGLKNLVDSNTGSLQSISTLKKHVSQWPLLAAVVPYDDILPAATMEQIDKWYSRVINVIGPARPGVRTRYSLEDMEYYLANAPAPLCVNSQEQASLQTHVERARELRTASVVSVTNSWKERESLDVPVIGSDGQLVDDSPSVDMINEDYAGAELVNLLRECRKSPIAIGTEDYLEAESKCRAFNRTLWRLLARPHVVSWNLVQPFLEAGRIGWKGLVTGADQLITGVTFSPNVRMFETAEKRVAQTKEWSRDMAAKFVALIPDYLLFNTEVGSKKKSLIAPPSSGPPTPSGRDAIEGALSAPPTATGEKSLDILLRQLDRDFADLDTIEPTPPQFEEYLYPLPLYQLPPQPTLAAPAPTSGTRKSSSQKGKPTISPLPNENPLLRKNLSPIQQLLFQIPWTRPGQGYLSPLNEVLHERTPEWCREQKQKLTERISRKGAPLHRALLVLLFHKRHGLFQTPEYVKIRHLAGQSVRTVRHCITRFPFVVPKSGPGDLPPEYWEKYILPGVYDDKKDGNAIDAELELFNQLLQLEALAIQVPTKYRLLLQILDLYDWKVRAQSVCHHMDKDARPRPWTGDTRALGYWPTVPRPHEIFSGLPVPPVVPGDPLCIHVVAAPPPTEFIICAMHISFFYVIESCRHFIRVMTDMCELCYGVTNTDQVDTSFWIACDICDKWFHGKCAGLTQEVPQFTCPNCVLASPNFSLDKKRAAQIHIQSLPPRRLSPIPPALRVKEADDLIQEAKAQPVVMAVNPIELQSFQKLTDIQTIKSPKPEPMQS
jgi:hypothetical protein